MSIIRERKISVELKTISHERCGNKISYNIELLGSVVKRGNLITKELAIEVYDLYDIDSRSLIADVTLNDWFDDINNYPILSVIYNGEEDLLLKDIKLAVVEYCKLNNLPPAYMTDEEDDLYLVSTTYLYNAIYKDITGEYESEDTFDSPTEEDREFEMIPSTWSIDGNKLKISNECVVKDYIYDPNNLRNTLVDIIADFNSEINKSIDGKYIWKGNENV